MEHRRDCVWRFALLVFLLANHRLVAAVDEADLNWSLLVMVQKVAGIDQDIGSLRRELKDMWEHIQSMNKEKAMEMQEGANQRHVNNEAFGRMYEAIRSEKAYVRDMMKKTNEFVLDMKRKLAIHNGVLMSVQRAWQNLDSRINILNNKVANLDFHVKKSKEEMAQLQDSINDMESDFDIDKTVSRLETLEQQIQASIGPERVGICPKGWYRLRASCYKLYTTERTWTEAVSECNTENAYLAEIDSDEENEFVLRLQPRKGYQAFRWLGGSDIDCETEWVWEHSKRKFTYTKWESEQPDDWINNEDCLQMYSNGKWNDWSCDSKMSFVCEKDVANRCHLPIDVVYNIQFTIYECIPFYTYNVFAENFSFFVFTYCSHVL